LFLLLLIKLRTLRNVSYTMIKPANPFILTGYHSPKYFCNRQTELQWMLDQLRNERNTVLYAWRRLGKTALISHFFHHLEATGQAECVFTDLMGTASIEAANRRIATAILDRFGSLNRGISQKMLRLVGSIGATVGLDPLSGTP
jgi:hypothetical protein